jgi:fructose-1,6-bisphosphatase I
MKFSILSLAIVSFASASDAFVTKQSAAYRPTALNVATESTLKVPVLDEVCETTGVTLKRYMNEVAMLNPELTELVTLFGAIDTACKAITNMVKRSQLPSSETLGLEGEVNVQGEDQKKLDVITNEVLKRALRFTGRMGVLASEEEDVPVSLTDDMFLKFCTEGWLVLLTAVQ